MFCRVAMLEHCLKQLRWRHRRLEHSDADGAIDRVGDGRDRRHDRHFADAAYAQGMTGVGFLDDDGFDHRQVEAGRHAVVEESGVTQRALVVVKIFFVERPAETLRGAALHLAFDVARMNRLARILRDGASEDLYFAGVGIDLDVNAGRRESRSDAARVHARPTGDWTAGTREAGRELLDRHRRHSVAFGVEVAVAEFHFVGLLLPDFG